MIQYDDEISQRLGLPLSSDTAAYATDPNNNDGGEEKKPKRGDKYSLRPRSIRRRNAADEDDHQEGPAVIKGRQPKAKQKPAPLSKYRRKTANARERSRMREINQAFETLRKVVPQMNITHQANEKLTKITTLRLAMKYIATLSSALTSGSVGCCPQDLLSDCSDLDCFLLESDGESLPLQSDFSDQSITSTDFAMDFPEDSLTPVDFTPLSPDFTDHLSTFDPFLSDFS